MAINKVVLSSANGQDRTLIDLTSDTVTPETLDAGVTAHDATGAQIVGTRINDRIVTTTGTGDAYIAQVNGITTLAPGVSFMMIPHVTSTSRNPTLDVNGLGAKGIRRRISNGTRSRIIGPTDDWLYVGLPVLMTYDGLLWIADLPKPHAEDLHGLVPVANGGVPTATTADNGKILSIVDGSPAWVTIPNADTMSF